MVHFLPDAALTPPGEAFVGRIGFTKTCGQALPASTGACNPEHGIDDRAIGVGISAWFAGLPRQQGRDAFEVFVGDCVAV